MAVKTQSTAKPSPAAGHGHRETLVRWLLDEGKHLARSRDVLGALSRKLEEDGIALQRVAVSVRVLHPQIVATAYVWRPGMAAAEQVDRRHDILDAGEYLNSPIRKIHEGSGAIRRRLDGPGAVLDFPILHDIREQGATDYVAFPMPFSDGSINVISFASERPGGFSDECIAHFEALVPVLSAVLEIQAWRRMAGTLLDTYLGHSAGERVLAGDITRGGGVTMHAVVWYSDLRNFTAMSDAMPRDDLMNVLNDYFECMIGAVEAGGGEVLKLIGDAVLAIFPIGDAAFRHYVCNRATDTALKARANMAALNEKRAAAGRPVLDFGIAMHIGDVIYGNIGSPERLDFTVIGPAVNQVTRIEGLCKQTGQRLLVSAEFARTCERPLQSLGRFALRGVEGEQEVFAIANPSTE